MEGRQRKRKARVEFTETERQRIVYFLLQSKMLMECSTTTSVWKRMSSKFPEHTWQSLKNHFIKKIRPMLKYYNVPEDILLKMRKRRFTEKDNTVILDYVKKQRAGDHSVSNNEFWRILEEKNILKGRSWQSLKQHYRSKLMFKGSNTFAETTSTYDRSTDIPFDTEEGVAENEVDFNISQTSRAAGCKRRLFSSQGQKNANH